MPPPLKPARSQWSVNSINSRLQKFSKDGRYLGGFGTKGSGPEDLDMPWGLTIDNQGKLYVADWNNHRVQKFSPGGKHLLTFEPGTTVLRNGNGRRPDSLLG